MCAIRAMSTPMNLIEDNDEHDDDSDDDLFIEELPTIL